MSSDWLATVQEDMRQAEYNITWQEQTYLADVPAAYQAPNRAHNLRTYFTPAGPIVISRTWADETDTPPWRIEIALAAWGRTGGVTPAQPATLDFGQAPGSDNLIHYRRDQLVEWYRNDENGLKQGFTLSSPPPQGGGLLQLDLSIRGDLAAQLTADATAIEFRDSSNTPLLSFGSLAALDADGQTIPARLSWDEATFSLLVDDTGAAYPLTALPGVEYEKQTFSFLRAINAIQTKDWSGAGFEKEVFEQTAKRAMSTTGSAGGYILPSVYVAEIIEMLRAEAVVIGMGATVLDGLIGSPIEIPKQTGGGTAYWVGENAAITPSDLTLGQVTMTPKAVAAMVKLSNRLIKLANPSAEAMVRRDIAATLANKVDLAALRGAGSATEPAGIANTASINTVTIGGSGGTFNFDYAELIIAELENDNALRGKLGFIWNPKVKSKMKRLKIAQYTGQTDGEYIILPMSDAKLRDYLGWDFASTTQIPTNIAKGSSTTLSEVYFGNWQELLVGQWSGMEIMASSETSDAFEKNQTWVKNNSGIGSCCKTS